ncbi:nodulin-26-like [Diospyros lotus]|uniref:nodulin-26-like n=1 Tax=Diospyros lotus TaxID=55363 RepID=UPI002252EA47|nr:nodulin-26-like [Diospyros lotus]
MAQTPSLEIISMSPKYNSPAQNYISEERKPPGSIHPAAANACTDSPTAFQKILAEVMGTYVLIFAGCGAALVDRVTRLTIVGIAMVWGLALMAVIYAVGHISGAHLNPAVTIAFAASKRLPLTQVPMYVLAQLLGATLACLTLRVLFNDQGDINPTVTQYSASTTDLQAIVWEFIISLILMFTICGSATDHRANKGLSGVAIGVTLLFNVLIAGPITGASMNPARSIGPAVVSGVYKNLWVYVVAPVLGTMAATLIYSLLRQPEPEKPQDSTKTIYNNPYADP